MHESIWACAVRSMILNSKRKNMKHNYLALLVAFASITPAIDAATPALEYQKLVGSRPKVVTTLPDFM